ncbi:TetR/AcrR family transcriptional regulator [Mycobacterium sp. 1423905.2]|uniref:TetR/AcrR family transcriptional regulator n=1 Tax=Mycobacterium sp. 1423905.2 TaxID=1856859 RepID=UPI0007FF60EB|nr:TetR/AcrR family transcriptional regulator [Mycobacterium sp. 1423905.2]OBJ52082.1 TetR family transcriptional regulator [Mycobacterium sp. 1423905.2]
MTTKSATIAQGGIPTGREEVAAAVLEAAADLFAERGPAATSIRDIAARSKVNHGLVFRHFGAKEQLVGAVLDHLGAKLTGLLHSGAAPEVLDQAMDRQMRVWARTLLDGYPAEQLQTRFPNVAELLEQVRSRHSDDATARLAVANALALQLGWRLFQPMLRSATGLDALGDEELRQAVIAEATRMMEPPAR